MSNGTRPAVSIGDLLSGDGPYRRVADDYLADVCSRCHREAGRDGVTGRDGYFCPTCWMWRSLGV